MAFAVGLICFGAYTPPPSSSNGWVYRSPVGDYRLTLPSSEWKEVPPIGGQGEVSFFRPFPRTYSSVLTTLRDRTEKDFDGMVDEWRSMAANNARVQRNPQHRDGINSAGHRYHYFTAVEMGPQGEPMFTAYSMTWIAGKRIVVKVVFEGLSVMTSQTGRSAEMEAMERTAEMILLSVE